jgi:carboxyl-terminal processing protease
MILRRIWVKLLAIGVISVPITTLRAAESPPEHPKATAAESLQPEKDSAKEAKEKADKAAADKQAVKDEAEFYDLYKALADTVDQVDRNYVKKVDRRELMEAAIKGVLSKLDPYSSYIPPADAEHFKDTVENQFGGIGIQITMDENQHENQLKILSPLVGTPGYKAGLLAGDRITKIGDESTANLSLDEAVHKLKGDAGSNVKLTVIHPGTSKPQTVSVTREVIHIDTVLGDRRKHDDNWDFMLDPDKRIGYIRITTFSRDTAQDLKKAIEELKGRKLKGLVLDLRFNPGGLLTSAVDTCDMFLSGGRIVSTEGRNTPKKTWDAAKKTNAFSGFPMAILVNHYSASASEIVSACLQDHNRAVVVGERTWGKGSVQNVIELEDGKSLLKLTTASYQRPNGHNIHRFPDSKESDEWGVSPSPGYEIKMSDAEMAELLAERRDRDIVAGKKTDTKPADRAADTDRSGNHHLADRQLQKALDYLDSELAKAP